MTKYNGYKAIAAGIGSMYVYILFCQLFLSPVYRGNLFLFPVMKNEDVSTWLCILIIITSYILCRHFIHRRMPIIVVFSYISIIFAYSAYIYYQYSNDYSLNFDSRLFNDECNLLSMFAGACIVIAGYQIFNGGTYLDYLHSIKSSQERNEWIAHLIYTDFFSQYEPGLMKTNRAQIVDHLSEDIFEVYKEFYDYGKNGLRSYLVLNLDENKCKVYTLSDFSQLPSERLIHIHNSVILPGARIDVPYKSLWKQSVNWETIYHNNSFLRTFFHSYAEQCDESFKYISEILFAGYSIALLPNGLYIITEVIDQDKNRIEYPIDFNAKKVFNQKYC